MAAAGRLPVPVLHLTASLFGYLMFMLGSRMQRVTLENIERCFPELSRNEKNQLARKSLVETGKTMVETCRYWTRPVKECLKDIIRVNDTELQQILASGVDKGVIFIVPHLGNWELLNHYFGEKYPLTHMYLPAKSKATNEFILSCRKKTGTRFVAADKKGIRVQLQELKAGRNIGAMPDQEPDTMTGDFSDFFAIPALTGQLIPRFIKTGRSIPVIATCCRLKKGFEISFTPIEVATAAESANSNANSELSKQSLRDISSLINGQLEMAIRKNPEQYLWSYKRFRTRPPGQEEFYNLKDPLAKKLMQKSLIHLFSQVTASLPTKLNHLLGRTWGYLARSCNLSRAKITQTNLNLCFPEMTLAEKKKLGLHSLMELGKTAAEVAKIWQTSDLEFERMLDSVEGLEHLPLMAMADNRNSQSMQSETNTGATLPCGTFPCGTLPCGTLPCGTLVLTPPLGNREVVMRYLGQHFPTHEYYHANGSTALDDSIRKHRYKAGISLYPHSDSSIAKLQICMNQGSVVALCPDQQPRLRGGIFVPFFGEPGLTTLALPSLLQQGNAKVVFGIALRRKSGFTMGFYPVLLENCTSAEEIIIKVNVQLEWLIRGHIEQYRWSDKRFNIRPKGLPRLYSSL